jgi:hypothetical protein
MAKEHGKATIVLLLGTSSAGKGAIIKELMKQDALKESAEQMNWHEDGLDLVQRRRPLQNIHNEILASNPKGNSLVNELANAYGDINIRASIFSGKVTDDFLKELNKEASDVASVRMKQMEGLIELFHKQFMDAKASYTGVVMEELFKIAVENSKKGIPTILDLVPIEDYDVVAEFNKYMSNHNFSCPAIVAVAHCEVKDIVAHMDKRNAKGDPDEKRDGFFPLTQYGQMYRAVSKNDISKRQLGTVTTKDILDAAKKYGADRVDTSTVVLLENNKDAQGLVKKLGIIEGTPMEEDVAVTTDVPYDALFQTESEGGKSGNEATVEIAKQLNILATRKSQVPNSPSPTAELINQSLKERAAEKTLSSTSKMSKELNIDLSQIQYNSTITTDQSIKNKQEESKQSIPNIDLNKSQEQEPQKENTGNTSHFKNKV